MYTGVHSDVARESGAHQNKHNTLIQVQNLWYGPNFYLVLYIVEPKL